MALFANLVGRLSLDSTAFDRNARRAGHSMYNMQRQSLALKQGIVNLAGAYYTASRSIRALTSIAREAADFNMGMARIHTMLDEGTSRYLPQYRKAIEALATEFGESTESLQSATYDILSASVDASKAMEVLRAGVIAAKGGFTSTAVATKAAVGIMNAYKMSVEDVTAIQDILATTVKRGVITYEELSEYMGTVASAAAALKVDLEAVTASIATMTRAGIPVDQAFTAIRNVLAKFKNPTDEAKKAAAELGFTLDATSIQGKGLIKIFDRLKRANAAQLEALMPSIRGFTGFSALLQSSADAAYDLQLMLDSSGRSMDAYNKVKDESATKMSRLNEEWKKFTRTLGEFVALPVLETFNKIQEGMSKLTPRLPEGSTAARLHSMPTDERQKILNVYRAHLQEAAESRMEPGRIATQNNWREDLALLNRIIDAYRRSAQVQSEVREQISKQMSAKAGAEYGDDQAEQIQQQARATQELIAAMKREAALAKMSNLERAKALAVDKFRKAIQKDIAAGIERSAELTAAERAEVERLAAEQYKVAEEGRRATVDITAAYVRMYDAIDSHSAASYDARRKLLKREFDEYEKLLGKTREVELAKQDALTRLAMDQARESDSPAGGVQAAFYDLKQETGNLGQLFYDLTRTGMRGFSRSVSSAVFAADDLSDSLRNVARSMGERAMEYGIENAMMAVLPGMMGMLGGGSQGELYTGPDPGPGFTNSPGIIEGPDISASVKHGGGTFGVTRGPTRLVDPGVFARAPRLHGGLRSDEFPAILQHGEEVRSRDRVASDKMSGAQIESLLSQILGALRQRQTLNATIVDSRQVVTRQDMEGREGERLVMHHVGRNQ